MKGAPRPAIVAALVALAVGGPARADEPTAARDPAAAEALFERGKILLERGDRSGACEKFTASQALDPSAATAVKIARCHQEDGKLATAWNAWLEARKLNTENLRPAQKAALADLIDAAIADLEPHVPYLLLRVSPTPPGLVVRRGEVEIPVLALGERLPVDPGPVALRAVAPGFDPASLDLSLADGEQREVTLELEPIEVGARAPDGGAMTPSGTTDAERVTAPPTPPAIDPSPSSPLQPGVAAGFAVGGAGIALLLVAGGFGVATLERVDASSAHCSGDDVCDPRGVELRGTAGDLQMAGLVLGATGAALVLGGVVLVAVTSRPSARTASSTATLYLSPLDAGVRGAF